MNDFKLLLLVPLGLLATFAWAANQEGQTPKASQEGKTPTVISAKEALEFVGKSSVRVKMTVKKAKDRLERRGIIFLDSEEDFTHADNLGVAISLSAAEELKQDGIGNLEAYLQGKTIQVDGCVMRFEERPYLPVLHAKQIRVLDEQ